MGQLCPFKFINTDQVGKCLVMMNSNDISQRLIVDYEFNHHMIFIHGGFNKRYYYKVPLNCLNFIFNFLV